MSERRKSDSKRDNKGRDKAIRDARRDKYKGQGR